MAAALVVSLAPGAGADHDDGPWPQARGLGGQSRAADATGPDHLSVAWANTYEDSFYGGGIAAGTSLGEDYFMSLDGHGHLLFTASDAAEDDDGDTGGQWLVAVDQDTGEGAWVVEGISAECKPAVSSGYIYAMLEIQGADDPDRRVEDVEDAHWALVGIDPEDGELTGTRYSGTSTYPLTGCQFGYAVQTAANGYLLVRTGNGVHEEGTAAEHTGPMLHAAKPNGDPVWAMPVSDCRPQPWLLTPPPTAPNANTVYVAESADTLDGDCDVDTDGNHTVQVRAISAGSGSTLATTVLPGNEFFYARHGYVRDDGDIVLATRDNPGLGYDGAHIQRLTDDGSGQLRTVWQVSVPSDRDTCGDRSVCALPVSMADGGDRVMVTFEETTGVHTRPELLALDADDGRVQWRYALTDGVDSGDMVVDANGTTYIEAASGSVTSGRANPVEAVTADGLRASFLAQGEAAKVGLGIDNLGPMSDDGMLFGWSGDSTWFALDAGPQGCPANLPDAFDDDDGGMFEPQIDCVAWWGVTEGADGGFNPGGRVTRGQMAAFLVGLLDAAGVDLPQDPPDRFTDDDGGIFEEAINIVADLGIANGTGGGTFSPAAPVTRGQMASFLLPTYIHAVDVRADDLVSHVDAFTDDDGGIFEDAINHVYEIGIASGTGAHTFTPSRSVTRGEMAVFLSRLLEELSGQGAATPPSSN